MYEKESHTVREEACYLSPSLLSGKNTFIRNNKSLIKPNKDIIKVVSMPSLSHIYNDLTIFY